MCHFVSGKVSFLCGVSPAQENIYWIRERGPKMQIASFLPEKARRRQWWMLLVTLRPGLFVHSLKLTKNQSFSLIRRCLTHSEKSSKLQICVQVCTFLHSKILWFLVLFAWVATSRRSDRDFFPGQGCHAVTKEMTQIFRSIKSYFPFLLWRKFYVYRQLPKEETRAEKRKSERGLQIYPDSSNPMDTFWALLQPTFWHFWYFWGIYDLALSIIFHLRHFEAS